MNHRQLELVRSSYERIRRVRALFADLFRRRLLLLAPELEPALGDDWASWDTAFLDTVDGVVQGLDRLDVLLPALAAYARRLHGRGVTDADYGVAGEALAWTVAQVVAGIPGALTAWRETYDLLTAVMRRAAIDSQGLPRPPRLPFVTRPYSDLPPPP